MNVAHPLVGRACHVAMSSPKHAGRRGIVVGVSGESCEYLHVYLDSASPAEAAPQREMFPRENLTIQPLYLHRQGTHHAKSNHP